MVTDAATAWAEAFAKAQAEFPAIAKTKQANIPTSGGGSYSYKYADLHDILEAVRPVLLANGLSLAQQAMSDQGEVGVVTRIYHTTGHVEAFGPLFLPAGTTPQSAGSALTYARRYSLCASLGIAADEDDDGAAASHSAPARSRTDAPKPAEPTSQGDPHCPACLALNGELVGVTFRNKKPYWKCSNDADKCAGSETGKDGTRYSWSGWHESFSASAEQWLNEHGFEGTVVAEEPEQTPGQWLGTAAKAFSQWSEKQRREASLAVMGDLGLSDLDMDDAKRVFEGMHTAYLTEHPEEGPF